MRDTRYKIRDLICLLCLTVVGLSGCQFVGQLSTGLVGIVIPKAEIAEPNVVEIPKAELAEPNLVGIPKAALTDPNIFEAVYELIYRGEFDAASELIKYHRSQLDRLARTVAEYQTISQRRQEARGARYKEQLAELEKFRAAAGTNDVNDANDANDITAALLIITKACEFADQNQKDELLSKPFVKQTIQKAIETASELESRGKWLDAYAICYSRLQTIDEENEVYSDYADELIEKANIAASFQDSPCESREERYEGVKKEMFVRAINALRFNYVNSIIDYRQMAVEAIRRCELLAEVMRSSCFVYVEGYVEQDMKVVPNAIEVVPEGSDFAENSRIVPEPGYEIGDTQYSAWLGGLAAILDEISRSPMGMSKDEFIDIFERVLALNTTTVELPPPLLIAHFAEASLSALDPYTVIVWPRQVQDFEKVMTSEFTGIGIEISKQKAMLTVVSLLPDTPAYNSGLDAGDVIEKVDGVETKDMSLSCAVKNITGPAGTEVKLTIRRPNEDKTKDITITRAKITIPTIRGWQRTESGRWLYMIDDRRKIGYIRITSFSDKTASGLEKVLSQLEAEGLNGLILDLRFNSGGLLNMAVEVTDKFLGEGPIVITRPRSWVSSRYASAHKEETHPNYPLVVLINRYSASASEIVAGALADPLHERAILVGERTHGKGSVQGIISYPRGGAQLKYTMAYYYLPSGQKVKSRDEVKKQGREDWGVRPDIEVKLRGDEIKKMFDVQRDNDVLVKADHDKEAAPLKKHTAEESLSADPQLAVSLLIVRSKLIQAGSEIY